MVAVQPELGLGSISAVRLHRTCHSDPRLSPRSGVLPSQGEAFLLQRTVWEKWDAFWDSITGLVEMPEQLQLIGWGRFAERFPRDANIMKGCLNGMSNKMPTLAARVEYL
jgi:hypothetical protein